MGKRFVVAAFEQFQIEAQQRPAGGHALRKRRREALHRLPATVGDELHARGPEIGVDRGEKAKPQHGASPAEEDHGVGSKHRPGGKPPVDAPHLASRREEEMGSEARKRLGIDPEGGAARIEEPQARHPRSLLRGDEKGAKMARLCLWSLGRRFVNRAVGIAAAIEDERHVCAAPRLAAGPAGPIHRRQVHQERLVFRAAAFPGDADARRLPHPVGDPLPGALPCPLHDRARREGDDILEEAPRRLPAAGRPEVMEAVARGPRQPPGPLGPRRHRQPTGVDKMLVGIAAAKEPVVVAGMGASEALGDREPVAGGASPDIPKRPLRLGTRLPRRGMIGDQRQRIEIDAEIRRRDKLRHPVCFREGPPLPPRCLPFGDYFGAGEIAEGEEIPGMGEEDVRVARLDTAAADCRQGVTGHRVDKLAAAG